MLHAHTTRADLTSELRWLQATRCVDVVLLCCLQSCCFQCLTWCAWWYSNPPATSTSLTAVSFSSTRALSWAVSHSQRISWWCCEFSAICSEMQLERDSSPNTMKNCFLQQSQDSATLPRKISRFAARLCLLQCFDTVGWAAGRAGHLAVNTQLVCWWWRSDWSVREIHTSLHHASVWCSPLTLLDVISKHFYFTRPFYHDIVRRPCCAPALTSP